MFVFFKMAKHSVILFAFECVYKAARMIGICVHKSNPNSVTA